MKNELPDLRSVETLRKLAAGDLDWWAPLSTKWKGPESLYRRLCADMCRELTLESKVEWEDYGSGYATFVDAWFYRNEPAFTPEQLSDYEYDYVGLWVLLSRGTPYFVMGEGRQGWDSGRGHRYLPCFESVDHFDHIAVSDLSEEVSDFLTARQLVRLRREDLGDPAPADVEIHTNLTGGPLRVFDVVFNWMD